MIQQVQVVGVGEQAGAVTTDRKEQCRRAGGSRAAYGDAACNTSVLLEDVAQDRVQRRTLRMVDLAVNGQLPRERSLQRSEVPLLL